MTTMPKSAPAIKCLAFNMFVNAYRRRDYGDPKEVRMGQAFHNAYIKRGEVDSYGVSLFYQEDEGKAARTILSWLMDNQYYDELPQKIR